MLALRMREKEVYSGEYGSAIGLKVVECTGGGKALEHAPVHCVAGWMRGEIGHVVKGHRSAACLSRLSPEALRDRKGVMNDAIGIDLKLHP